MNFKKFNKYFKKTVAYNYVKQFNNEKAYSFPAIKFVDVEDNVMGLFKKAEMYPVNLNNYSTITLDVFLKDYSLESEKEPKRGKIQKYLYENKLYKTVAQDLSKVIMNTIYKNANHFDYDVNINESDEKFFYDSLITRFEFLKQGLFNETGLYSTNIFVTNKRIKKLLKKVHFKKYGIQNKIIVDSNLTSNIVFAGLTNKENSSLGPDYVLRLEGLSQHNKYYHYILKFKLIRINKYNRTVFVK